MTLSEILTRFIQHARAVSLYCEEALVQRQRRFDSFAALHGHKPLAECKPFDLSDWIEDNPGWKSTATRKAVANQINAAINWAVREGRIASNPFRNVNYAEADPRPALPDAALEQIELFASKPFERALRFLRLTGCRLSDLCRMTWADIDQERACVVLQVHKSRKKTGRPKVIVLVKEAVELLAEVRRASQCGSGQEGGRQVFLNSAGTPWTRRTLGQQLRRLKAKHGIEQKATLHGIRHQFGTEAVRNGAPLKMVSMQLGHASTAITERYYVDLTGEIEGLRRAAEASMGKHSNGS